MTRAAIESASRRTLGAEPLTGGERLRFVVLTLDEDGNQGGFAVLAPEIAESDPLPADQPAVWLGDWLPIPPWDGAGSTGGVARRAWRSRDRAEAAFATGWVYAYRHEGDS